MKGLTLQAFALAFTLRKKHEKNIFFRLAKTPPCARFAIHQFLMWIALNNILIREYGNAMPAWAIQTSKKFEIFLPLPPGQVTAKDAKYPVKRFSGLIMKEENSKTECAS